ncbi:protein phosphatase 2C domain-containing protein [Streptomyces sp. SL13]|uniref:Protein phosphatase 2C domain-containing protein n=1 Tax=Streptantibioticus silvisoli TaxID=2705255 RepID=A0AA90KHQ9_9ACTN|nr:protein phosphatase 2C domain-containing protein [Streptantibioticus silvisoli]MDI5964220.1 protein phosphatase 2C domain-containing protein [Streptantibioticus silvisoli]MDI5971714.1 protein phosphatase 2C domain-containing protein [Streptantibioticus silvisoli]
MPRASGERDPARPYVPARVPAPPEPAADSPVPALPAGWAQVATAHAGLRPTAPALWPAADPDRLADLVPDTVLDGAGYGRLTVRALSVRGDDARALGAPRGEALLTARFGEGEDAVLLLALAGDGGPGGGHPASAAVLRALGEAVGNHRVPLLDDLRAGREQALRAGLRRITERVRSTSGDSPLSAALLPVGTVSAARVYFGVGPGVPLRMRGGVWRPLAPGTPEGAFRLTADLGRPGDVTLLYGPGLAGALRGAPRLAARLAARWAPPAAPPNGAGFLADLSLPVPGHTGDRSAVAVWDAPEAG